MFLLGALVATSHQWTSKCHVAKLLSAGITENIVAKVVGPSSCQYSIQAPIGYRVLAECTLDVIEPKLRFNCYETEASQCWYVNTNGDQNLTKENRFCGQEVVTSISIGNELAVGYNYTINGTSTIRCALNAIQLSSPLAKLLPERV